MILTVTASPVLLSTHELASPIEVGANNSMVQVSTVAGGFGTGVANTLFYGGMEALAVFPVPEISHYLRLVNVTGLPHEFIPVAGPIPMHLTMRDEQGGETVFRDSPMPLDVSQLAMLRDLVVRRAEDATWVFLGGELPDIAPATWYVDVVRALRLYHPNVKVAIATSGAPLRAVVRQLAATQPDVLIISGEDLETSTGTPAGELGEAWRQGDLAPVSAAARTLIAKGISQILVTVNRSDSLLLTESETHVARFRGEAGKQGVSWRESLVAGYLSAAVRGVDSGGCLSYAVAYGNAAGSEWDNFIPTPDRVLSEGVELSTIS